MRLLWIYLLAIVCVMSAGKVLGENILMFSADWCKYCHMAKADLLAHQEEVDRWMLEIVDVDVQPDMRRDYDIKSLPTFIVLDDHGREVRRLVGYKGYEKLRRWVDKR